MTAPGKPISSGPATSSGGNFLTRKVGPLAAWIWMALLLLAALIYSAYRNSKAQATAAADSTNSTDSQLQSDNQPPMVFQDYVTITPPTTPPVGGRTDVPGGPTPTPTPTPPSTTPTPAPKPKGSPAPTPKPKAVTVTVARFTSSNPPWNSTISGIAGHYGISSWQSLWNSPANAALKSRRKSPDLIQPGDKVVVTPK